MGWSAVYKLPWPALEREKIEAATEAVLGRLPDRLRESELIFRNKRTAYWNVEFFPDEEREYSVMGDPDLLFRKLQIEDDDALTVSIGFHSLPDDNPPQSWFEFDSTLAANRLMSGCAMRLAEMLGGYFGVVGEVPAL